MVLSLLSSGLPVVPPFAFDPNISKLFYQLKVEALLDFFKNVLWVPLLLSLGLSMGPPFAFNPNFLKQCFYKSKVIVLMREMVKLWGGF
jgi:hypothetical protein